MTLLNSRNREAIPLDFENRFALRTLVVFLARVPFAKLILPEKLGALAFADLFEKRQTGRDTQKAKQLRDLRTHVRVRGGPTIAELGKKLNVPTAAARRPIESAQRTGSIIASRTTTEMSLPLKPSVRSASML